LKRIIRLAFLVGGFAVAAGRPVLLTQMPGFPAEAAEVLAMHGITTDREFLLAGQVNSTGVAEALGVKPEGVSSTVASLWRIAGREWAQSWALGCRELIHRGTVTKSYQTTPLLALTGLSPLDIRKLVKWNLKSAESLYATFKVAPDLLAKALGVTEEALPTHVDCVRQGAPHAVALIDRTLSRKGGQEKLQVFLTATEPQ
jgi:hypothetical protein